MQGADVKAMTHECLLCSTQEVQYSLRERFWLLHVWQMRAMGEDTLLRAWDRVSHQVSRVYSGGIIERPGHHQCWDGDRIQAVNGGRGKRLEWLEVGDEKGVPLDRDTVHLGGTLANRRGST